MDRIDQNALSNAEQSEIDASFARMRALDQKLFAMKAERRALADKFLELIARQKNEKSKKPESPNNIPCENVECKALYGVDVVVHNT